MEYFKVGRHYLGGACRAVFPVGGFGAGPAFSVSEKEEKSPGQIPGYRRDADRAKTRSCLYLRAAGCGGPSSPDQTAGIRYAEKQALAGME